MTLHDVACTNRAMEAGFDKDETVQDDKATFESLWKTNTLIEAALRAMELGVDVGVIRESAMKAYSFSAVPTEKLIGEFAVREGEIDEIQGARLIRLFETFGKLGNIGKSAIEEIRGLAMWYDRRVREDDVHTSPEVLAQALKFEKVRALLEQAAIRHAMSESRPPNGQEPDDVFVEALGASRGVLEPLEGVAEGRKSLSAAVAEILGTGRLGLVTGGVDGPRVGNAVASGGLGR